MCIWFIEISISGVISIGVKREPTRTIALYCSSLQFIGIVTCQYRSVRLPESIWDVPLIVGKNKVVNDEHRVKATDSFLQDILKSIELDDKNINGVYFDFLDSWGTPSQRPVNFYNSKITR